MLIMVMAITLAILIIKILKIIINNNNIIDTVNDHKVNDIYVNNINNDHNVNLVDVTILTLVM